MLPVWPERSNAGRCPDLAKQKSARGWTPSPHEPLAETLPGSLKIRKHTQCLRPTSLAESVNAGFGRDDLLGLEGGMDDAIAERS